MLPRGINHGLFTHAQSVSQSSSKLPKDVVCPKHTQRDVEEKRKTVVCIYSAMCYDGGDNEMPTRSRFSVCRKIGRLRRCCVVLHIVATPFFNPFIHHLRINYQAVGKRKLPHTHIHTHTHTTSRFLGSSCPVPLALPTNPNAPLPQTNPNQKGEKKK